ncbi:hypothetical protein AB0O07_16305 [Streptomyces sp. NPDC093085]|uniref:hypothetical protein n=1 Tax=Streptomyces sp. NPDC093085 TaxID=3155068 RepID=UPI003449B41B
MSFEEEWVQQKRAVADGQSSDTRLNQLPAESGGSAPPGVGDPDLATAPAAKKKAANTIENQLEPGTKKAADTADEPTSVAVAEFKGWDTGTGLKKAHEHWDTQVKRLMGRLNSEKVSLRNTSNLFAGQDLATEAGFAPLRSKIDGI